MNLVAIPQYGIVGAATATALAEGTIMVLALVAMGRLGVHPALRPLITPTAAAAIMAAILLVAGREWALPVQIAGGAALYAAAFATLHMTRRGGPLWSRGWSD